MVMKSIKKILATDNLDQTMIKMYLNSLIEEVETLQNRIILHEQIMHDNGIHYEYEDN